MGKIKITEPFEPHLERFARALDLADFYQTPANPDLQLLHRPPATTRRRTATRSSGGWRSSPRRAAGRGVTLMLENEKGIYGDTAARVARHPRDRRLARPVARLRSGQLPRSRPDDRRGLDDAPAAGRALPRQGLLAEEHKNVPAGQGDGQIPRLIADAVAHGYDGFCVLEPHLVLAEQSYGFTGPERFGDAARALKACLDKGESPTPDRFVNSPTLVLHPRIDPCL